MNNSSLRQQMESYDIKRLLRLVAIIIPLALIGNIIYLFISTDSSFVRQIGEFDPRLFALAVALALLPWLGQSAQILIWGRVFHVKVSPPNALKAVLASDIGAAITPTMLGGGYAKLGFLVGFGFSPARATLVTVLGILADAVFFVLALPAAVYLTSSWKNPHILGIWHALISHWPVAAAAFLILFGILIIVNRVRSRLGGSKKADPRGSGIILNFRKSLKRFKVDLSAASGFVAGNGKAAFVACVILSGIGWCGRYSAVAALAVGLGIPADPVLFFLLQWVVFTTMTMIPTPGAIGGAEVSFALIYNGLIPTPAIPVLTAAWRFVTFYVIVGLASLIYVISRTKFPPRPAETEEIPVADKPGIPGAQIFI